MTLPLASGSQFPPPSQIDRLLFLYGGTMAPLISPQARFNMTAYQLSFTTGPQVTLLLALPQQTLEVQAATG